MGVHPLKSRCMPMFKVRAFVLYLFVEAVSCLGFKQSRFEDVTVFRRVSPWSLLLCPWRTLIRCFSLLHRTTGIEIFRRQGPLLLPSGLLVFPGHLIFARLFAFPCFVLDGLMEPADIRIVLSWFLSLRNLQRYSFWSLPSKLHLFLQVGQCLFYALRICVCIGRFASFVQWFNFSIQCGKTPVSNDSQFVEGVVFNHWCKYLYPSRW